MTKSYGNRRTRRSFALLSGLVIGALPLAAAFNAKTPDGAPAPPVAAVRPVTDEYFGVKVADPYRYMENLKDPGVTAWFKGQNEYTRSVLARIPGRARESWAPRDAGTSGWTARLTDNCASTRFTGKTQLLIANLLGYVKDFVEVHGLCRPNASRKQSEIAPERV